MGVSTLVSSRFKGYISLSCLAGSGEGTWIVSLLQIRAAMEDTQRYRAFPCVRFLPMKQGSHLIRAFVVLSVSLVLGTSAGVPQATDRPLAYTKSLNKSRINANAASHVVQKRAFGKVQAAYFSNWYVMCAVLGFYVPVIDQLKGHLRRKFPYAAHSGFYLPGRRSDSTISKNRPTSSLPISHISYMLLQM